MGKKRKKKQYRGHYCWCCGCNKPNERFSGRGHRDHICKDCQKMPKEKRQQISDGRFAYGILRQKSISKGNITTLEQIAERYPGTNLGRQGAALAKVGRIKPGRKKRIGKLYFEHKELFDELVALNLIWDSITPELEAERYWEELGYGICESFFLPEQVIRDQFELIEAYEQEHYGELIRSS